MARHPKVRGVGVVEVIRVLSLEGDGTTGVPFREVVTWWTFDGVRIGSTPSDAEEYKGDGDAR